MRITLLAVVAFAQLASVASAVPFSNQPGSPANEHAVLQRRYKHRCDNYPKVLLGHEVAKRELSTEMNPLETRSSTREASELVPRHHKHPKMHWCRDHSDMWLSFRKGKLPVPKDTVGELFSKSLQYTTSYIATDPYNALFTNLDGTPIFLGSVYPNASNSDSDVTTQSMYALNNGLTWPSLDTAVRILQNYIFVRHDYTAVNATIYNGRKAVGTLSMGGPLLPNGYYLTDQTYPISDNL